MIKKDYGGLRITSGLNMNNLSLLDYKVRRNLSYDDLLSLDIREIMDQHKSYDKEKMLNLEETDKDSSKEKK